MNEVPRTGWGARDAALYLLGAPLIAHRTAPFVDVEFHAVSWDQLVKESVVWSSTERWMVQAALSLWTSDPDHAVNLGLAVDTLDDGNFTRLLNALRIARGRS